MPKRVDRSAFFAAVQSEYGDISSITRPQIVALIEKTGIDWPAWLTNDTSIRLGRGVYALKPGASAPIPSDKPAKSKTKPAVVASVPVVNQPVEVANASDMSIAALQTSAHLNLVPNKAKGYVPFGNFSDVRSIVKSQRFYPIYITGLSGNGKTMMVEQVHAAEGRELIRVNVTIETDEDDLLGGFRLIDGKTVWQDGPVVIAMERGATLLLDEVDLGSNKMMCLQPVMEGKSVFLKKINRLVTPAKGFNVIATANTKGKGSEDGRFIGTNVQNEAMLDRYAITMEQEYPALKVEQKILTNVLAAAGVDDKPFVEKLVNWADVIRKSFYEGAVSEIISTRRLVNICEAFVIFNDRAKAIQLCLNRFDVDTKNAFMDLYTKLDETVEKPSQSKSDEEIAF